MSLDLPNPVLGAAMARGDAPALVTTEGTLTWREVAVAAQARATVLAGPPWHVRPGDVVALEGSPGGDWVVTFHALGLLGAAVSPLPFGVPGSARAAAIEAVSPRVVVRVPLDRTPEVVHASVNWTERFWPLDEVRVVICTSGTTGAPRAVPLTTAQIAFGVFGSTLRLGHLPDDRWLACLPLHAIGGLSILLRAAFAATTVELHAAFDAAAVGGALVEGRITHVSLVPSMLAAVLDALERAGARVAPRLRCVLLGGAPTPPALVERARAAGLPLALTWGMSETGSQIATWSPGAYDTAGVGAPLAFARVEADADGRLQVRGPVAPGGALATGDLGTISGIFDGGEAGQGGAVTVTGRVDDLVNSGGAKIAPAEVEAVLAAHPGVAEVAVVAVPDSRYGQRPAAFLVLHDGAESPDDAALRAHCHTRMARHKCPDFFFFLQPDDMPRGPTGKVDRRALLSRAATGL